MIAWLGSVIVTSEILVADQHAAAQKAGDLGRGILANSKALESALTRQFESDGVSTATLTVQEIRAPPAAASCLKKYYVRAADAGRWSSLKSAPVALSTFLLQHRHRQLSSAIWECLYFSCQRFEISSAFGLAIVDRASMMDNFIRRAGSVREITAENAFLRSGGYFRTLALDYRFSRIYGVYYY